MIVTMVTIIEKDIKQEIVKNSLGVTKLLNQPNKIKYLLYKLGLLKILFETQSKLLRYR